MGYKLIGLAVAGACGALARCGLAGLFQRGPHIGVPWGTLAANVLGCFLFGLVWTLTHQRLAVSPETRTVILVGFLGSFTTFSAFVFETDQPISTGIAPSTRRLWKRPAGGAWPERRSCGA